MLCHRALLFATPLAILLIASDCSAQGRTTGATSGSAFSGSSSLGTSRFGSSGFGTSSLGGSSLSQSSLGSQAGGGASAASGFGSNTTGQQANQGFVGRAGSDLESFFGGIGAAVEGFERADRARRRSADAPEVRRPEVRVRLTVSPELNRQAAPLGLRTEAALTNVSRLLTRKGIDGVRLSSTNGVVRLEGTVRADSERRLVEKLAAIEPGIRSVDNRLVVAASGNDTLPAPR